MKTVLTIAGFDPSSGAGITADLMVFAAHGLFGTACITALTVQSTLGVRSIEPVRPDLVSSTLEYLDADLPPSGVKIGMVASEDNINTICNYLDESKVKHEAGGKAPIVVLDPVLQSSSGRELLNPEGLAALRKLLLPRVHWITPNLDELRLLSGEPVLNPDQVPVACRLLQQMTVRLGSQPVGILATGGHSDPPDDFLLTPSGQEHWIQGERVNTRSTHGTGCSLSSAFLSRLVLGDEPREAALAAKEHVAGALRTAVPIGSGHGPMNHLWRLRNENR